MPPRACVCSDPASYEDGWFAMPEIGAGGGGDGGVYTPAPGIGLDERDGTRPDAASACVRSSGKTERSSDTAGEAVPVYPERCMDKSDFWFDSSDRMEGSVGTSSDVGVCTCPDFAIIWEGTNHRRVSQAPTPEHYRRCSCGAVYPAV